MTTRNTLTQEWWVKDGLVHIRFYDLETQWGGQIVWTPQQAEEFGVLMAELAVLARDGDSGWGRRESGSDR